MNIKLQDINNFVFRNKFQRSSNETEFKPCFYRFIGVDERDNYNNVLRTIKEKANEHSDKCVIFDNSIPVIGEMDLLKYIYSELETMNVTNMAGEDISVFTLENINNDFLMALDYVIPLSIRNENFLNDSIRNNFITKLILWAYTYLASLNYESSVNPKCIYYGNIERHEIYFLILLYIMGFDVIYINPLNEDNFESIDKDGLSKTIKSLHIDSIDSFEERSKKGHAIEQLETITKFIEKDIHTQLFQDTGIYKPWQFRDGYTKSLLLDSTIEDIFINWNEKAKVREGFGVQGNTVKVPCFFTKIDGENHDVYEYQRLVKLTVECENTLVFTDSNIFLEGNFNDDMYQLIFCELSDGTFNTEEVKKTSLYRYQKYRAEVQDFVLNKINEIIKDKNVFIREMSKEDTLEFLVLILSLDERVIRMIDNFDFTGDIPKIVVYLNREDNLSSAMVMVLAYLHNIGFDIVIFNPSGLFNINNILNSHIVKVIRLEKMNYESDFKQVISLRKGFLSKILRSK